MVIVDSSVWVDAFADRQNRETRLLWELLGDERIGLCDLVLCEVLQGARSETEYRHIRDTLLALDVFEAASVSRALAAAANYRLLRARGLTVRRTVDCLIATFCLEEGHSLLHNDRDFDAFEAHLGLRVIR
jgi:predicted nucleic acid-binding protein